MIDQAVRKELVRIIKKIGYRSRGYRKVPYGRARYRFTKGDGTIRLYARPWNQFAMVRPEGAKLVVFINPTPVETFVGSQVRWVRGLEIPLADPGLFDKAAKILTALFNQYSTNEESWHSTLYPKHA